MSNNEKKTGVLCANIGAFDGPWGLSADRFMEDSGHNIGNFAFWRAADVIVSGEKVKVHYGAKAERFQGLIDKLVIPAANFLNDTGNLGWLADFIEELDIPCVVFGLGAQSEDETSIPKLSEGTVRFLNAVSRRTPFIGIRGEFTKKVCEHFGVFNVEVLGCPSILLNPNRRLGRDIEAKWERSIARIAVHAACIKSGTRNVERRLFEFLTLYPGSSYIIQRPVEFIKVVFQESLTEADERYIQKSAVFLNPDEDIDCFLEKLRRFSYVPFTTESWIHHNSHFSHALGTRIHGTLLSLASEIPAICIHHDTRTKELCDALKVPAIGTSEIHTGRNSISQIFSHVRLCGEEFDENRLGLAKKNKALLSEVGIASSKHLNFLAG